MKIPEELGMRHGWIYEVVASTQGDYAPHAAPIGIMTPDGVHLRAELYKGSTTLDNILNNSIIGLNLPHDALLLQASLYDRQNLDFTFSPTNSRIPFLQDADAWMELHLAAARESANKVSLEATLSDCHIRGAIRLVNRAHGLLLESLVLSTRRHLLGLDLVLQQLQENARVINKVAPGSSYAAAIRELLESVR